MLRYGLASLELSDLIDNWPFSYDRLALPIWGSQEMKPRHAPRFSVAIRGSVEITQLLLYYG